jgi:hypothetical protein
MPISDADVNTFEGKSVDAILLATNREVHVIDGDGNCQFAAIAHQVILYYVICGILRLVCDDRCGRTRMHGGM